jgi:hypothetical protein
MHTYGTLTLNPNTNLRVYTKNAFMSKTDRFINVAAHLL